MAAKTPPQDQIFSWRAINDSLPCFNNLYKHKIVNVITCKFCNYPIEDLSHALINNPSLSKWSNTYLPSMKPFKNTNSYFNVVIEYKLKLGNEEFWYEFLTIAWCFWGRRNKLVYEDLHIHPQEATERAFSLSTTYKECN